MSNARWGYVVGVYVLSAAAGYCSCADLVANHFPSGLNESALSLILRDVVQALCYLHSRRIIHRAIRGRHILVTGCGKALLSCLRHAQTLQPFSMCHTFSESDSDNVNWLSPELLAQDAEGYDQKSDVYRLVRDGILMRLVKVIKRMAFR